MNVFIYKTREKVSERESDIISAELAPSETRSIRSLKARLHRALLMKKKKKILEEEAKKRTTLARFTGATSAVNIR